MECLTTALHQCRQMSAAWVSITCQISTNYTKRHHDKSTSTGFSRLLKSAPCHSRFSSGLRCGVLVLALAALFAEGASGQSATHSGSGESVHGLQPLHANPPGQPSVSGTLLPWHPVTLDFDGPVLSEQGVPNPFRDYRMSVQFDHVNSGLTLEVPGYFAADGNAAESGATSGTVWRAHLAAPLIGQWTYCAKFHSGANLATSLDPNNGIPLAFHGETGLFTIAVPTSPSPGFLSDGMLISTGETFLRHAGNGKPFLKFGANSPENFLAYVGFDQTPDGQHVYAAHNGDWTNGDPSWHGGLDGRSIIGALNYLAQKGMNALYMLTFNVNGDGDDVWPWTSKTERLRYDCSKLDQWEIVFEHMDRLGISMQLVLQEQENDNGPLALDGGSLGLQRKIYQRELIARFGHHLGLILNLGEENQNTTAEQLSFYDRFRALDAYGHPIVVHTFPTSIPTVYPPLLAAGALEGASLQVAQLSDIHQTVLDVRQWSLDAQRPWAVTLDEIGPPEAGVIPDSDDYWHTQVRHLALWGSLMAGSAGCEWYFGYSYPHNDLDCEDWRSRDNLWDITRAAKEFFELYLDFDAMVPADELVVMGNAWCLANPGIEYALYQPAAQEIVLDLQNYTGSFDVAWYDPRNGGELLPGSVTSIIGPGLVSLGTAPQGYDWAVRVRHANSPPQFQTAGAWPNPYTGQGLLNFGAFIHDPNGPQDLVSVNLSVVLPSGSSLMTVPLEYAGNDFWTMSYDVPSSILVGGTWAMATQAIDSAGNVKTAFGTFEVL
ncbi:MAG: hypothetical protein ACI9EF_003533 [Pseudohongiellaceae bacterium]|jgi:hypothetical protein